MSPRWALVALLALVAEQGFASCPPPSAMLRAIRDAKQVRIVRLGGRVGRTRNPMESSGRFIGFEIRHSVDLPPRVVRELTEVFGRAGSYECPPQTAQNQSPALRLLQVGFDFVSKHGNVRLILFQPEREVEMEFENGALARLPLSNAGADAWDRLSSTTLPSALGLHDFGTLMRAADDSLALEQARPGQMELDRAAADAPEVKLEVVTKVNPEYPDLARQAGVDGTVLVRALVDPSGRVRSTTLVKSIPLLDAAATKAVRQWEFTPAREGITAVWAWTTVPVRFTLN